MKLLLTFLGLFLCTAIYSQEEVYINGVNRALYKFSPWNCALTFVGVMPETMGDIALTDNGRLWGIYGDKLYLINKTTAAVSYVKQLEIFGNSLVELDDSTLLTVCYNTLYSFNVNTGAHANIGYLGVDSQGDLAWYDDDLYLSSDDQKLIRIKLNDVNTAIDGITVVGEIPGFNGLISSHSFFPVNTLLGFSNKSVYKVCQITGESEIYCELVSFNLNHCAAARRNATQHPEPIQCYPALPHTEPSTYTIALFPNPLIEGDRLTIKASGEDNNEFVLSLTDICGKIVLQKPYVFSDWEFSIDLSGSGLSSSVYFVGLASGESFATGKLVYIK